MYYHSSKQTCFDPIFRLIRRDNLLVTIWWLLGVRVTALVVTICGNGSTPDPGCTDEPALIAP